MGHTRQISVAGSLGGDGPLLAQSTRMDKRGVVSAFLLSSSAVLVATQLWGTQALVPFTVGELTGAIVALVVLGSSVCLLRDKARNVPHIRAAECRTRSQTRQTHEWFPRLCVVLPRRFRQ